MIKILLLILASATAALADTRNITVHIVEPLAWGDTCDILYAPLGFTLVKLGTATRAQPNVIAYGLTVGQTYDFTSIVHRGTLSSITPPRLHYVVTTATGQKLLGVAQ